MEAKTVIELFDLTAMHLPTRKVGLSWSYVLERGKRWAGELYAADKADRFHASAGWLQKALNRRNYTLTTMRGEAGEADEEYERRERWLTLVPSLRIRKDWKIIFCLSK